MCGVYFFICPVYFSVYFYFSSNKKHESLVSQTTNMFASIYLEDPSSSWCFFAWMIGVWLEPLGMFFATDAGGAYLGGSDLKHLLKQFSWINFDKIFAEGATKTSQFLVNKFLKKWTIPLWSIEQHILKSSIFFSSKVDWWTSHELWMASSSGPCGCGRSSTQISLGRWWVTLSVFFCEFSSVLSTSLNYRVVGHDFCWFTGFVCILFECNS